MNDSLVKLEDFQLDEISGGVTLKQAAKKVVSSAVKGTCALTLGAAGGAVCGFLYLLTEERNPNLDYISPALGCGALVGIFASICISIPVLGWNIGKKICKSLEIED